MTSKKTPKKKGQSGTSKASAADKKILFIEAYLSNGGNATQAAIAAGYSKSSARRQGHRMTTNVHILSELDKRRAAVYAKFEITTERILQERARLAFFDPRKLFDIVGKPIPIHELDDDTAAALAGLDVMEEFTGSGDNRAFVGYTKKYKLADKGASLTALEKIQGMYEKDNKQKTDPLRDLLGALSGNVLGVTKGGNDD